MENTPNAHEEVDLQALRRCRQGETSAFAEIVERYQQGIYRLAFSWTRQRESAEELAQETFLKAYRGLEKFRGESKFSTWLYQIAMNLCRDRWRVRLRRPEAAVELENWGRGVVSEPDLAFRQEQERLNSMLGRLLPIYREALALRYFSELSYEEIAQLTGAGLSNVKMRVARALEQLRKMMGERKEK
ncbi:MAG TPA: RNA polymerase subunit sigma-24 [Deltaproteobacteria bacterium]|nr:RNA polymerase subunit sigma-24 [Deltaproteobacteria bacterium]